MNKLKLGSRKPKSMATLAAVFLLCVCVGVIAGSYIKKRTEDTNAASSNITVVDNNQVVTADEGTPTIVRSSTVTVKDTMATAGYTLKARIENNSVPNSTVTIGSASSGTCTLASPCAITSDTTPTAILETSDTSATQVQGHTTEWTVTITLPTSTSQGNYILDIAYVEDPIILNPLQEGMNLQDATSEMCNDTALGITINLRDVRDGKYYRIRKMADSRCWMIDNLAYDLANPNAPIYNPAVQLVSGTTTSVDTQSQYVANPSYTIPNNGTPTQTYLYNWCAAMGDTSVNCATTIAYGSGQPATPQTGICPAPFRLPIGGSGASTPGNGTNQAIAAATTNDEFAKLDIWLGGTGTNRENANTHTNFTTDSAISSQFFFSGVFSGEYNSGLDQGSDGHWWSSSANSDRFSFNMVVLNSANKRLNPGGIASYKYLGFAVRCVL